MIHKVVQNTAQSTGTLTIIKTLSPIYNHEGYYRGTFYTLRHTPARTFTHIPTISHLLVWSLQAPEKPLLRGDKADFWWGKGSRKQPNNEYQPTSMPEYWYFWQEIQLSLIFKRRHVNRLPAASLQEKEKGEWERVTVVGQIKFTAWLMTFDIIKTKVLENK